MKKTPLENWIAERTLIGSRTAEELAKYQLSEILYSLSYAKDNSKFYGAMLKDIDLKDIRSIKDIENIPFTYPEDIRNNNYDFLCIPMKKVKRIVTINTSGTSGVEKRIFFTDEDLERTVDFFQYGMKSLTDENDRVLILLPGKAYGTIGDLLKKALIRSKTYSTVYGIMSDENEVEKIIIEKQINCIVGIPMQILRLSRIKRETFKKYVNKVLLSTDYIPDVLSNELKSECQCDVYKHYGMTEMGYGGGVECECLSGYHLREGDMYFEIVDPVTGKRADNGEYGEVVFTTFRREAMPLIRYRTGDIARISSEKCQCGTFLRVMDKVKGRLSNYVDINGIGNLHFNQLDEIVLKSQEVINYNAELLSGDILSLSIELKDSEKFIEVRSILSDYLNNEWKGKLKFRIDAFNIHEDCKLMNSMVKRFIKDGRKENIHE